MQTLSRAKKENQENIPLADCSMVQSATSMNSQPLSALSLLRGIHSFGEKEHAAPYGLL